MTKILVIPANYKSCGNDPIELEQIKVTDPATTARRLHLSFFFAFLYVISGVIQPIIISYAKYAGLASPRCQLYMLFYYFGPALVGLSYFYDKESVVVDESNNDKQFREISWLKIAKAGTIGLFDLTAQSLNYTGSAMAGPTIFAIIYSSVTVWTAVYSVKILNRQMSLLQWLGVLVVFLGLTITGLKSASFGVEVLHGALLVILGSSMHALQYVLSEAVMTKGDKLTARLNCTVQGIVASSVYFFWQLVYTRRHFHDLVYVPMQEANTSYSHAIVILLSLTLSSFVHSSTFFYTLKNFPGGAVSAGVMKGLQAVLVFVGTSLAFCGRNGGDEMCFTQDKMISLIVVLGGVILFARATEIEEAKNGKPVAADGYVTIADVDATSNKV